jgi:sulfur carrier protein
MAHRLTGLFFRIQVISVSINGALQHFDTPISIAALLEQMQLGGKRIALECNGAIVPRGQFNQQLLAEGDKLEIVVAVGGG